MFHLAFGISAVATEGEQDNKHVQESNSNNVVRLVAVVEVQDALANIVFDVLVFKKTFAHLGWLGKTSTDCIHNGLGFDLTSESGVIDYN